ncbi:hypothetical protein ACU6U9_19520 [Pseudomonas sp. HK3]
MKFQVKYNPHSDLASLAQYQLDGIEKKQLSADTTGLTLDIKACLISHAFLAEALINMAGFGLFREKFKEKDSYHSKRKKVLSKLDVDHIEGLDSVFDSLQSARNTLAHAKPERYEYELQDTEDEFAMFNRPYEKLLNLDFLKGANRVLDGTLVCYR